MSFLEMLDVLNEQLIAEGEEPIAFDHDCREGICGMCSLMINGTPARARSGPPRRASCTCATSRTATRSTIEPWRASGVPGDQGPGRRPRAFDRIIQAGGFITGQRRLGARRATRSRCRKADADRAMDAAACIGCGACVAACPNALGDAVHRAPRSPTSACCRRASPSAATASRAWSTQMDAEGFGNCTNNGECEAACPKGIPLDVIGQPQPRLPEGDGGRQEEVAARRSRSSSAPLEAPPRVTGGARSVPAGLRRATGRGGRGDRPARAKMDGSAFLVF